MDTVNNVRNWASDIDANTLVQAERTAALPILAGPVALMPDAHLGIGATIGSVIATRRAIVPAAVGVDLGCFVGDTLIPLLNGRQRTLRDLAENQTDPFWVYSINADGKIVPGRATALLTRQNAELMRVVVSGGDEIVCTPDHLFMLRDGTYREARNLQFNNSLMPFYRKWQSRDGRKWQSRDGYESVGNGDLMRLTHILVYESINGPTPGGHVVHHENHNHFNNDPTNLRAIEKGEHSRHHRLANPVLDNASAEFQAKRRAGIERRKADPEKLAKMVAVGTENITRYMKERPDEFRSAVAGNGKRGAPFLAKFNITPRSCDECDHEAPNPGALYWHKKKEHASNHKVIAIESIDERSDVYCLQVEEHHNFALAAGVFVHNCGMIAVETDLVASDLPDDLTALHSRIEQVVPAGVGKGHAPSDNQYKAITNRVGWHSAPFLTESRERTAVAQFGSLGSGNHFVEICLDERDVVWVTLHSGSRGIGNQLAQEHIKVADSLSTEVLEDRNLAWLVEDTEAFRSYVVAMLWAQDYAAGNREQMMEAVLAELNACTKSFKEVSRLNCHHNYCESEIHNGEQVWVTRKGAIRAQVGDLGLIPGSMGTSSYVVEGLGNPDSYNSCSHGAGRRMSRTQARKTLDVETFITSMDGKTWDSSRASEKNRGALIEEDPRAYKSIDQVMEDQKDLVSVRHRLTQVLNYKG